MHESRVLCSKLVLNSSRVNLHMYCCLGALFCTTTIAPTRVTLAFVSKVAELVEFDVFSTESDSGVAQKLRASVQPVFIYFEF